MFMWGRSGRKQDLPKDSRSPSRTKSVRSVAKDAQKSKSNLEELQASWLFKWLGNAQIRAKLSQGLIPIFLLTAFGYLVSWGIFNHYLRQQIETQAKSELALMSVEYNEELNQSRYGNRGPVEFRVLLESARNRRTSAVIKSTLQTETSGRDVSFMTLVDDQARVIEESSTNASRVAFDPNGLVTEALESARTVVSNEIISYAELERKNPALAAEIGTPTTNPFFLVHYRIEPLIAFGDNAEGAVITGDVVNLKTSLVDNINQSIGTGFAAISINDSLLAVGSKIVGDSISELNQWSDEDAIASISGDSLKPPEADDLQEWNRRGAASFSPIAADDPIVRAIKLDRRGYTVAAAPILNAKGQPVGVLMRGTGHENLNSALSETGLSLVLLTVLVIGISVILGRNVAKLVAEPIGDLEDTARQFTTGNMNARARKFGNDEVGTLSTVFNQMADNIRRREADQRTATQQAETMSQALQEEVAHLLDVVSELEDGDFTVQAEVSNLETGLVADTLNRLTEQLATVIATVLNTAQQVTANAENLEELAIAVATNAQEQAQSAEQARNGMAEVNNLAQSAANQAITASSAVQSAQSAVTQGESQIINLTAAIASLQEGSGQMVQRINSLGEFVDLAKQFVQDQKRLASLTQVLAMNASMVAARAVEQKEPDQFASVAREFEAIAAQVNNLATQTGQGLALLQQRTGFIEIVVSGINQDVSDVNELVDDFTASVEKSRLTFDNIEQVTKQVAEIGQSVTDSSQAIANSVRNSFTSIQNIADVAERSAQQARFTREQSAQMGEMARMLLENVQFFRLPSDKLPTETTKPESIDVQSTAIAANGNDPELTDPESPDRLPAFSGSSPNS
ncbi:methyl-accepting chemotaxis sensory transducer [Thalassoporum mexicanum PCC 7367]|nr:methyl-accepting chemotaxis sensory transducer [Pseudanabaena sp. PCC 7367]